MENVYALNDRRLGVVPAGGNVRRSLVSEKKFEM
jgi:hypothetical protein